MSNDSIIIEKAKNTISKIILVTFVAPVSLASLGWLVMTTMATKESVAVIQRGQIEIVKAMDRNTDAIKQGNKDNASEHGILAEMVHETTANVGILDAKVQALKDNIDHVQEECDDHQNGDH